MINKEKTVIKYSFFREIFGIQINLEEIELKNIFDSEGDNTFQAISSVEFFKIKYSGDDNLQWSNFGTICMVEKIKDKN